MQRNPPHPPWSNSLVLATGARRQLRHRFLLSACVHKDHASNRKPTDGNLDWRKKATRPSSTRQSPGTNIKAQMKICNLSLGKLWLHASLCFHKLHL
ncbi:hypothetical protein MGG_16270 [Pyricularia oryzae 70-15]|uniref:Uncharacterized protein n=1 Tax=Pyricularia oryzae (strain 70-15 / ATCC MYA-4617 / FGSC 8958) TaxID=242507 RepID=G4MQB5_PYRO7|nr:uncharacterized protein MGG_16270 [Pyricularia oryzae 70-15]EHA57308.1 hypothetical protein MGG_16270 [Pyricularia oryzae 70-15]